MTEQQKTYAYLVLTEESGLLATHYDKDVAKRQAEAIGGAVATVVVTKDFREKEEQGDSSEA